MAGNRFKIISTIILFTLPALVLAEINVQCTGIFDGDISNLKVFVSGSQDDVVSPAERSTFKIDDNDMKNAASKELGTKPDYIYARSPTPPYGDLYETYGWKQVTRTLVPTNGTVLGVSSTPIIVTKQIFENNSTHTATFKAGIQQTVQDTLSSSWNYAGELTVSQGINFGFSFMFINGGGSTTFSDTSIWGRSSTKSQTVTVGSSSGMDIELKPQESVQVQLLATKGTVKLQVDYEASLSGDMAMKFDWGYKNQYYWMVRVNKLMARIGLPNKKTYSQVLEFGFYSQSKVIVRDGTGRIISAVEDNRVNA